MYYRYLHLNFVKLDQMSIVILAHHKNFIQNHLSQKYLITIN